MHTLWKSSLFLTGLFLLIACGNPDTPALTTIPPSPTAPSADSPANTPAPAPEEASTLTDSPNQEKVLTILYWQAPTLPGPYLSSGNKDEDAGAITLEPLAKYDPAGNLLPSLAAEIPTFENGGVDENLTSITWNLKEGLKWSDGSDMTAHDVAFTWRYCSDEATGCTASAAFTGISTVKALDNLTVRIGFDAPTPYPYTAFVGTGLPSSARPSLPTVWARPRSPARNRTPRPWAPARTGSLVSKQMRRRSTSAIPSIAARNPTSTGW